MKFEEIRICTPDYSYEFNGYGGGVKDVKSGSCVLEMVGGSISIEVDSLDKALDLIGDVEKIFNLGEGVSV